MTRNTLSCAILLLSFGSLCHAQLNVLSLAPPKKISVKAGTTASVPITIQLRPGYHVNSDMPPDPYLIPLHLMWTPTPASAAATDTPKSWEVATVNYPKPQTEKFSFFDKPLSIFSGDFDVVTRFKFAAGVPPGQILLTGKLRFQACNDRMCLPPRSIDVTIPVEISN